MVVLMESEGTYQRGIELKCPDCITGLEHCCPFLWADSRPEPERSQLLRHMRGALADVIREVEVYAER